MALTNKQVKELENAMDEMSIAKKELRAVRETINEAPARRKLLQALDKVNVVIEGFKTV